MVAAGSVVAAVEGLQMRMVGSVIMLQKLTEQLAQTIRSDPVGTSVYEMVSTFKLNSVSDFPTKINSYSTGLSQGMSGANWDIARNQSQTAPTATLDYYGN